MANDTQQPRPIIPGQTIVYYTLAAIERGAAQGWMVIGELKRHGHKFTARQVSSALQRLKKDGLVEHRRGRWQLAMKELS